MELLLCSLAASSTFMCVYRCPNCCCSCFSYICDMQHVSVDGISRPATNQDTFYWLTQNHSADWRGMIIGAVKEGDSESLFMIGLKQWKLLKVPVWHSLNKYLLLFTEVTYIASFRSHWAYSKTSWTSSHQQSSMGSSLMTLNMYVFFFSHTWLIHIKRSFLCLLSVQA